MPFYERGDVRIRFEEAGSGFPLLVTPGGGLNSRVSNWPTAVFNSMEIFKDEFRCITMDQRNANGGKSTGPIPAADPWGAFADDQLGLMDHLGIRQFLFMGYCIGGCFALKLMERAPERVVAGVLVQTVGHHPEHPDYMYDSGRDVWAPSYFPGGPISTRARSSGISMTFTASGRSLFIACRETSRAPAKRRCSSCPTKHQPTRWYPLSRSLHSARMPRSRCSHGASRPNLRPGRLAVCASFSGRTDDRGQRPGSA